MAAGSILVVWGASTIADIWSTGYSPPEGLNTIALAAATYLFGSAFLRERGQGQGPGQDEGDDTREP